MTKRTPSWLQGAVLLLLGLICVAGLWRVLSALGLEIPLDPNEGWNAYHTAAAMNGHALYPPPTAYLVNNYPPLSYYIVGAVGLLAGDNIVAGRLVSLLSLLAVCVAMAIAARRMGASSRVALLPPLLFATGLLLFSDYAGMDDPQMLAHAFAMAGLVVLLREKRRPRDLALAAILFALCFFVKHNLVALPAAATLWLFLQNRRDGLRLAAYGLGLLLAGLVLFDLVYGRNLLTVVATARLYSWEMLRNGLQGWLRWSAIPLALLAALFLFRWRNPFVQLCALYAVISTGVGIIFMGGAGVDANAHFDADIALALAAALVLKELGQRAWAAAAAYAAPLLFFAATNAEWQQAHISLTPVGEEAAIAKTDIAFLKEHQGPALCEMLSFCYWAGKPPAVDVFNVGQQFDTGARDDAELVHQIEAKHFAVIQFDPDSPYSLGENVHNAMARAYRAHHSDWYGTFYVPR